MKTITRRSDLKPFLDNAMSVYLLCGIDSFVSAIHNDVLKKKVKYPLLEYAATDFFDYIPAKAHIEIADKIIELRENGSDVIAGKLLQLRLARHYDESMLKAAEYIVSGGNWLSCDTIAERVFGYALLVKPGKTIPVLKQLSVNENKWIVRAVGVAVHYAVKKGLTKTYADRMFCLLQSLAVTTDFHTKKGIGWAAKTTAKFHPDIIRRYEARMKGNPDIKQWFRSKIKVGLGRSHKYAQRYTG